MLRINRMTGGRYPGGASSEEVDFGGDYLLILGEPDEFPHGRLTFMRMGKEDLHSLTLTLGSPIGTSHLLAICPWKPAYNTLLEE